MEVYRGGVARRDRVGLQGQGSGGGVGYVILMT